MANEHFEFGGNSICTIKYSLLPPLQPLRTIPPEEAAASSSNAAKTSVMRGNKVAEGKLKESFLIVKRSEDLWADFQQSMAKMVVGEDIRDWPNQARVKIGPELFKKRFRLRPCTKPKKILGRACGRGIIQTSSAHFHS